MNLKMIILLLLILSPFITFASAASASETDSEIHPFVENWMDIGVSREEAQKMLDSNPPTNPSELYEIAARGNVLAIYGEIPQKMSGADSYDWFMTVNEIVFSIAESGELNEYNHIGLGAGNFMTIAIEEGREADLTDDDLEAMRAIVYKYAEASNVENFPLVIQTETIPIGYEMPLDQDEANQNKTNQNEINRDKTAVSYSEMIIGFLHNIFK
ncbi:hypothetical protein MmiHf6_12790 [Methanimicrococcus hongohii]|uniref:Uncharacterized protein n=1 Tax=Methanimicrococcus hongohii TaxID=3028295 RepID=A0AA96V240_9EURY|nr:hypothetical protein [Methanimicrococcus sp. Hf6]WNY23955.1 hypothetical protein MmiHf6_12790 [Methanimicrococcus sp. Hf6]